jgi:hypothetical protein
MVFVPVICTQEAGCDLPLRVVAEVQVLDPPVGVIRLFVGLKMQGWLGGQVGAGWTMKGESETWEGIHDVKVWETLAETVV